MRLHSFLLSLLAIAILCTSIAVPSGCANIIPPQGGPRDTIPPVLLKATPADGSVGINNNRLSFSFDEFIELQNTQQEVIVSPLPATTPVIESKLKEITVRLRDTLEPNTTYTIQFGNAIKDYNEGNVLKGFSTTFSTGSQLDSGMLTGKLILAESGKIDSTLIVVLHRSADDSAIVNQRPAYITRLNGQGEFRFQQLPDRDFYLYALKDDGGMRRLLGDQQRVAFADSAVHPNTKPEPITLYAFDLKEKEPITPAAPPVSTPGIKGRPGGAAADKRLRYTNNLNEGKQDLLRPFELTAEQILTRFDSSKIRLYQDTNFQAAGRYTLSLDSNRRRITLKLDWAENAVYKLVVDKDALKDTLDRQLLKSDTLSFSTRKRSDYGKLSIRVRNANPATPEKGSVGAESNPVLQLVLNETIVASAALNSDGTFRRDLFLPGTYEVRILYDRNKNGRWDRGQLFPTRLQPERVRLLDRKITVKPNWENEYEL